MSMLNTRDMMRSRLRAMPGPRPVVSMTKSSFPHPGWRHVSGCGCGDCCRPLLARELEDEFDLEWESEVDRNSSSYTMWVQTSLNRLLGLRLAVDGLSGTLTRSAVRDFQARQGLAVDGIVGPNTEAALVRAGAGQPPGGASPGTAPSAPPASGNAMLSGAAWVARFPTSRSIDSLVEPFRGNTARFVAALQRAGASVSIAATRRPPERAYCMHYAWMIAREGLSPAGIPRMAGVDIQWVHTDSSGRVNLSASRAAAEEMARGYALKYEPSLTSRHIEGRAIDMTIGWGGTLSIADGRGAMKSIASSPRTGSENRELWAVGASYGVVKLSDDPPHWSDDGH